MLLGVVHQQGFVVVGLQLGEDEFVLLAERHLISKINFSFTFFARVILNLRCREATQTEHFLSTLSPSNFFSLLFLILLALK